MKILAIRGRNLASLEADFELDFTRPPLAQAGLFAISGPTAAGKTTILDAVCLALFDRTPRFSDWGGAPIGRADESDDQRPRSNDPRNILTHGTADGFAEVDFLGCDDHRYRARWRVRRARQRASGRLQPQTLEFTNLDTGTALADNKTQALHLIEEKLGLSFEQFRRAVLLAQGDFAAFLKANADERAALLERMTGTDIYARLSVAAHERARDARSALEGLKRQAQGLQVLAPDVRADIEQEIDILEARLGAAQARLSAATAARSWWATLDELRSREQHAATDRDAALAAWEDSAVNRHKLDAILAAQPLRGLVDAVDSAESTREKATADRSTKQGAHAEAAAILQEAHQQFAIAASAKEEAEQSTNRQTPILFEAARLDAQIAAARTSLAQAQDQEVEAMRQAGSVIEELRDLVANMTRCEGELAVINSWLAAHSHLMVLSTQWPRWQAELDRYGDASSRHCKLTGARDILLERLDSSRAQSNSKRDVVHAAKRNQLDLRNRLQEVEAQAARCSSRDLRSRRTTRATHLQDVLRLLNLSAEYRRVAGLETSHNAGADTHYAEAKEARDNASRARLQHEAVTLRLAEARIALARAQIAQNLESHRADLVSGEPCPLCGSVDHPWADMSLHSVSLVADAGDSVAELEERSHSLLTADATHIATAVAREAQAEQLHQDATCCRNEIHRLQEEWRATLSLVALDKPIPPSVEDPAAEIVLGVLQESYTQELEALEQEERRAQDLQEDGAILRHNLDEAVLHSDTATRHLAAAEQAVLAAEHGLAAIQVDLQRLAEACQQALTQLSLAFEAQHDWQPNLAEAPEAFARFAAAQAELWDRRRADHAKLETEVTALRTRVGVANARVVERDATLLQAQGLAKERAHECDALCASRAELLDGQSTETVRAELNDCLHTARQRWESASLTVSAAESALSSASSLDKAAREVAARCQEVLDLAASRLAKAVEDSDGGVQALRERLAYPASLIAQQTAYFNSLRDALTHTRTIWEERTSTRREYEGSGPPPFRRDEILIEIETADARIRVLQPELECARGRRALDDAKRVEADALATEIDSKESQAAVWQTLDDLIGSGDGKKFRIFAQSLSLDRLLALTNQRLAELAPRYRLTRVPGYDLDLQVVDRDMADEVRGVNSLSGGESFLVSLALALGLSAMSSPNTMISSLFIDEGFSALDTDTLDVALSVLDTLQSSGRTIGLISHLPGLTERVEVSVLVSRIAGGRSVVKVLESS